MIDKRVLERSKRKLRFSNLFILKINNIVIVNDSPSALLSLNLISETHKQKTVSLQLPCVKYSHLHLHSVHFCRYRVVYFVVYILPFPSLQFIKLKLEVIVMPWLIPTHHRIIVSLSSHVLICPLAIFSLVHSYRPSLLIDYLQGVLKVSQFITIIIIPSLFLQTQIPSLRKSK